jgi:hypothetical protein
VTPISAVLTLINPLFFVFLSALVSLHLPGLNADSRRPAMRGGGCGIANASKRTRRIPRETGEPVP